MTGQQESTLGTIPGDGEKRDAIHVAILPAIISGTYPWPGDPVDIIVRENKYFAIQTNGKGVGVVDPFLNHDDIKLPTRVWILLHPNTITDMRHHWDHPRIPEINPDAKLPAVNSAGKKKEIDFMNHFAAEVGITYEDALAAGDQFVKSGGSDHVVLNYDTPEAVYNMAEEYWRSWSIIREEPIPEEFIRDETPGPFTCSC